MPVFRRDGKNILFIHVPKTGGSTVEAVFRNSGYQIRYLDGKVGPASLNRLRRCTPQHMHGQMLEQAFRIPSFDLVFMMVRDPMARFKSEFIWRNRKNFTGADPQTVHRWGKKTFAAYASDHFILDNHIRPQSEFHVQGARIYHLEDGLQYAMDDISQRYRLDLDTDVPRSRQAKEYNSHSSSDVCIAPKLEKLIKNVYASDYAQFGYAQ